MKNLKYKSKRQSDQERQEQENKHPFCNHSKDMWCQDCIAQPQFVDLTKQGLGKGYIFTNLPLPPDNPNGSNRTANSI